jgi:hypothetical protein
VLSLDAAQSRPFEGLYGFIRHHLTMVNAVVLFASTIVAAIDFLSPKLAGVPTIIYSVTAMLVGAMLAAAAFPVAMGKVLSKLGIGLEAGGTPLWKRPTWRLCLLGLVGVSLAGFASVAHTTQGGIIASSVPAARSLQESMLGLSRDVADIRLGVDAANTKLDALVAGSLDPQKDLVARGYPYDANGLMKAIKQGDRNAVALFGKAGYRVDKQGPLSVLINGLQPWDEELAGLLSPAMFENPEACKARSLLQWELKPPAAAREAAFKRLCGPA